MLYHLQFTILIRAPRAGERDSRALAWPRDEKAGYLRLVANPLDSIGYGSEALALADLDRWYEAFDSILEAEVVMLPIENA